LGDINWFEIWVITMKDTLLVKEFIEKEFFGNKVASEDTQKNQEKTGKD
jgi:hypothetical protein